LGFQAYFHIDSPVISISQKRLPAQSDSLIHFF
jgi:hypothetical protein